MKILLHTTMHMQRKGCVNPTRTAKEMQPSQILLRAIIETNARLHQSRNNPDLLDKWPHRHKAAAHIFQTMLTDMLKCIQYSQPLGILRSGVESQRRKSNGQSFSKWIGVEIILPSILGWGCLPNLGSDTTTKEEAACKHQCDLWLRRERQTEKNH